jgi:hypothetical protein
MAPLLASRVFFSHTDPNDLSKVQWTYLGIAAFVFLLAVVFFFSPIPEVTDADMALQAEQCSGLTGYQDKPMKRQYKLMFGVAAQFCYVGAQVWVILVFSDGCTDFDEGGSCCQLHQLRSRICWHISCCCVRSICHWSRSFRNWKVRCCWVDDVYETTHRSQ